jgi:hypothetical protein
MSINQSQANAIATAVGPEAQKNIQRYVQARVEAAARAGLFSIFVDYDLSGTAGYELGLLGFGITQSGNQWVVDWSGSAPPPVPPIPGPTYVIPPVNGGTGINSYAIGDLIIATAATTLANLAIGAANTVLTSSGSLPQWGLLTDNNISTTADITLSKVNGGTANRLIASTGPLNRLAVLPAIAANRLLQSDVNGLPVALPAITPDRLLASNASGLPTALAAITPGHVLYADANGLPVGEAVLAKSRGGAGADMSAVTFPSTGTLVTEAGAHVLTNKDYDGGTASNTRRLTVPKNTLSALQGLTRKEATLLFASDIGKLYVDDGTNLSAVGAGSGSINYCTNPDAEASITGWTRYKDSALPAPEDGAGGTPNITWERTTTSPLDGQGSFLLTKDTVNRQGEGVAFDFTIAPADLGKQLTVSFVSQSNSGYVANDVLVYVIADPSGTPEVIQLTPAGIPKADSTGGALYTGTFQAGPTATSYRLCFHVATNNAASYELKIDRVSIAPSPVAFAAAVTDPTPYTPTLNSNTGVAANNARWWRAGRYMMIEGAVRYNGTGAASTFTVALPAGYTIDSSSFFGGNDVYSQVVGFWGWYDSVGSTASRGGVCWIEPGTPNIVRFIRNDNSSYPQSSDFGAGDRILYHLRVPIAGWGSNVQIGSYDGRTVSARYTGTAMSGSFTAANDLKYNNRIYDTHDAYNTSTGLFTAPVAGYYRVSGVCTLSATTTANSSFTEVLIYKNGSLYGRLAADLAQLSTAGYTFVVPAGSTLVQCNAGDTISLRVNTSGTISSISFNNSANHNYIDIELVPGRSTLAAADTVAFAATKASGSAANGTADVTSYTTEFDTTGSFNASSGVFTAPTAGVYSGSACVSYVANATGARSLEIQVNGSTVRTGPRIPATSANDVGVSLGFTLRLNAGDTVKVRSIQTSGASLNFSTVTAATSFSMERVGN